MLDKNIKLAILVSALGYFVDAFDLLLFSILRVTSLTDLGLSGDELLTTGKFLINCQMWGMLIGGVVWGILGDKIGRIQILFGSIFLYSLTTFLNGFVTDTTQYAILRFLAGFGLAGELGGGITLVAELMPKDKRGIGTTIIATVGITGVVCASIVGQYFSWRTTFMIGGNMGFLLLFLRVGLFESDVFHSTKKNTSIKKGSIGIILFSKDKLTRYLSCIAIATPTWFLVGVIMTFCKEIGESKGIAEPLHAASAVMWCYIGLTAGDLTCGLYSQYLQSRKKAILHFLIGESICLFLLFLIPMSRAWHFYVLSIPLGFFVGYWVIFVTTAAEQFGTNLRATVATSVPNLVRACTIPMVSGFVYLKDLGYSTISSSMVVASLTICISFLGLLKLRESFDLDLNYVDS